jgi:hypothetical protein
MAMLVALLYSLLVCLQHVRYQATSVADTFQTVGYLVPIIASLCICIMPRARFVEMMLLNTVYYTSCLNEIKTDLSYRPAQPLHMRSASYAVIALSKLDGTHYQRAKMQL